MTLDKLLSRLDSYESFFRQHHRVNKELVLGNHQMLPIFDAVENGLKRFFLAYGTSAGKTVIPLRILHHLQANGHPTKTLVIAPYQTTSENWRDEDLRKYGVSMNVHQIDDQSTARIPANANFVVVNFDKLPPSRSYLENIIEYARNADMIIVDEFHNLKNIHGRVSHGFQQIVEVWRDARLIALSATPAPDRLRDMGMVLYAIDPIRYAHYKDHAFDPRYDPDALWELRESGKLRFFSRKDVADFFGLPPFIEHNPIVVDMSKRHIEEYLEAYTRFFGMGGTLHAIERVSIEAMIASKITRQTLKEKLQQGYVLNFFSHLRNPPKNGSEEEGIFYQLEAMLRSIGAERIRSIHGGITEDERKKIQAEMAHGSIDALINQWDCSSEGFSEIAGNRPVVIVPLRSPFTPGTMEQIYGRSYREGQRAPVECMEFQADSEELRRRIEESVIEHANNQGKRIRASWFPSLFASDAYKIRKDKEREIQLLLHRKPTSDSDERTNVDSIAGYAKLLSSSRIIDSTQQNESFGSGTGKAIKYVGISYEHGLRDHAEPLGKDYNREDILLYAPGKTNLFLARYVEKIKQSEKAQEKPWKIADLGCCSSAVFAQARLLWQSLHQPIANFDEIYSIDGNPGFVRSAEQFIRETKWSDVIPRLTLAGISNAELAQSKKTIDQRKYRDKLHFHSANFTRDDLGGKYNVVIASQCLQYNDQSGSRDIESIVMNVNRSLRKGGHYLTVMTGNSYQKSFTKSSDVDNYKKILEAYGFDIIEAAHIHGRQGNRVVLKPFHFVHAIKRNNHENGFVDLEAELPIYTERVEVLTGGYRMKSMHGRTLRNMSPSPIVPDGFFDDKGNKLDL